MEILVKGLCKAYGDLQVLDGFTHAFPLGKTSCIMGKSGCGKTTLLRILLGLEKPDRGEMQGLEGKRCSAVFQEDRLCENLSAGANIRLVRSISRKELDCLLEEAGLPGCQDKPVRELSGGMKRRIAILRALLAEFDVLFLDEPFQGLDQKTKEAVLKIVKRYTQGKTVLTVTHTQEEVEQLGGILLEMPLAEKDSG